MHADILSWADLSPEEQEVATKQYIHLRDFENASTNEPSEIIREMVQGCRFVKEKGGLFVLL